MDPRVEAEIAAVFRDPAGHLAAAGAALGEGAGAARLGPRDYVSPERHARELAAVFRQSWIPAAPSEALAAPGAAVTVELGGEPVVLVADERGRVRALRNVCLHRGAVILREPRATLRSLRCPYHGFEYGLDGALAACPAPVVANEGARPGRTGLAELPSASFAGWTWVHPGDGAPPLADYLGRELHDELGNYALDELRVVAEREFDGEFDWKVGVEAFLEPLHVPSIHRRSAHPVVDHRRMAVRALGEHSRMALPFRAPRAYDADGPLGAAAHAAGVTTFPGLNRVQREAHFVYFVFPSLALLLFPNHALALRFLPRSAGRTRVRVELRAAPAATPAAEAWRASLVPGHDRLIAEDMENLPWIQRGLASPSLERLELTDFEVRVAQFHCALARRLEG